MEESSFTLIGRYQYSSEAFIYKGKLESNGIEVFIRDNNIIDSNPLYSNAVGGIKLFVKNEAVGKAKELLSEISTYSLDDNNQLIKCPKCDAEQVAMAVSIKDLKSLFAYVFSFLFIVFPFYTKYKYKCEICKHEFD